MANINCAICESADNTAILFRRGIFAKGGRPISFINVICKNCGLVYRSPRESAEEMDKIYKNGFLEKRHFLGSVEEVLALIKSVNQKNKGEQIAEFLSDFINRGSRILDVGSGLGLVGGFLRQKFGVTVEGVEPSELSARVSSAVYDFPVFGGTFDAYVKNCADSRLFDCFILHHVFEHFSDPLQKLAAIAKLLTPKGVVYIEVPNVLDFKKPISQFFDFFHFYSYSPATLARLLKLGGFKVIKRNKNKRYRLQIVAAPLKHHLPEISLGTVNSLLARRIIWYCRAKTLIDSVRVWARPLLG